MTELVNHPKHYTSHPSGIEPIALCRHLPFSIGNCVKYLFRAPYKGTQKLDLAKSLWYLDDAWQYGKDIDLARGPVRELHARILQIDDVLSRVLAALTREAPLHQLPPVPNSSTDVDDYFARHDAYLRRCYLDARAHIEAELLRL